jgi:hypothetical protein
MESFHGGGQGLNWAVETKENNNNSNIIAMVPHGISVKE